MILITGATGNIGRHLAKTLAEMGHSARALHRKPEDGAVLRNLGHEPYRAGLEDRDVLKQALMGCDTLFLLPPPVPQQERLEANVIDAANAAGVARIVKVSAADAGLSSRVPWARAHAIGEDEVRRSGLRWTILRPTAFFQNFLELAAPIKRGILPIAAGRGRLASVDARDVATVAAQVLTQDGHDRATYVLTGPEALAMQDAARVLGASLGRRIRYLDLPTPAYRLTLLAAGLDGWLRDGLVAQFGGVVAKGHGVAVTEEVRRLTGHPARTFGAFVDENSNAFSTNSR